MRTGFINNMYDSCQNSVTNTIGSSGTLQDLSMYSNLYIFEPRNATGANVTIADTVGSAVTMSQTDASRKPTISGNYFNGGANLNDSRGLTTSASITFKEVFIVTEYTASTFSGFSTLASGTGTTGAKRVMGTDATANLNTTTAINATGLIRVNNGTAKNTAVLPLSMSVVHTCTDFTTPADISDTYTIGYNIASLNRAWIGRVGVMIFCKIALNDTQRLEVVNTLKNYHGI